MSPAVIQSFIFGVCGLFAAVLMFLANRWVNGLDSTLERLNITMGEFAKSISHLDRRMDGIERDVQEHNEAWHTTPAKGTRCSMPGCPYDHLQITD